MSVVYFMSLDGQSRICLDCETSLTVGRSNTVSQNSIMSGANASDGVIAGNHTLSLTGVVSYTKTVTQVLSENPTPIEFINMIDELIENQTRFTVTASTKQTSSKIKNILLKKYQLLNDMDSCVIVDYSYTIDRYSDTISVTLNLQEQYVTYAAVVSATSYSGTESGSGTTGNGSGKNGTKKNGKSGAKEKSTLLVKIASGTSSVVSSIKTAFTSFFGGK